MTKASTFLYGTTKGFSASQVRHSLLNELDITRQANGTASPFKMLCSRPTRHASTPSVPALRKADKWVSDFEGSLLFIVSSKPSRAVHQDRNNQKKKKNISTHSITSVPLVNHMISPHHIHEDWQTQTGQTNPYPQVSPYKGKFICF